MHRTSRDDFACAPDMFEDVPVVVEHVLTEPECQQWLTHISTRSKNELVQLHRGRRQQQKQQQQQQQQQQPRPIRLQEAMELLWQHSSPVDPMYATSMGSSCSTDQLPLTDTFDALFDNEGTEFDDTFDWFRCFARHAPVHDTLIMAGAGTSSPHSIQCHPFTKLILCLEGSQVWRLLLNSKNNKSNNKILTSTSTPMTSPAWENFEFSTGYQASPELDLFKFRHRDVDTEMMDIMEEEELVDDNDTNHDNNNGDGDDDEYYDSKYDDFQQWVEDPANNNGDGDDNEYYDSKYDDFQQWVEDPAMLVPSFPLEFSVVDVNNDDNGPHLWHSTVTRPGDLLVIPPGWWYQSYNFEPSVSVSSQRCGGSVLGISFIKHILKSATPTIKLAPFQKFLSRKEEEEYHTSEEAQVMVDTLFDLLEEHYREISDNMDVDC